MYLCYLRVSKMWGLAIFHSNNFVVKMAPLTIMVLPSASVCRLCCFAAWHSSACLPFCLPVCVCLFLRLRACWQHGFNHFVLDKKAACAAIAGYVKARRGRTIMNCDIDCCTGKNCNDGGNRQKNSCLRHNYIFSYYNWWTEDTRSLNWNRC